MKSKQTLMYNFINILFLVIAIMLVNYNGILEMHFNIWQIFVLIFIFIVLHIFKFIRIYFILLEERVTLKEMVKMYVKTTFVSIVLPYKLGEIYKMYLYGYQIKNYTKGVIAVIIEKFFDAIILCFILIPFGITNGKISLLAIILLIFILFIIFIYLTIENTYSYLNRFFITSINSKRGLLSLNIIEKIRNIFIKSKELLHGRFAMLFVLTILTWLIEIIFVCAMSLFMKINICFDTIASYISDAFFGINNVLFNNYIYICTAIFLLVIILIYVKKYIKGSEKNEKNSISI